MPFYPRILASVLTVALLSTAAAKDLAAASEDVTLRLAVSHSLPLVNQRQALTARIAYRGAVARRGALRFLSAADSGEHAIGPDHPVALTPGMDELAIAQPWTPDQAGRYTLTARWEPAESTASPAPLASRQIVTAVCRPLHFHYWSVRPSLQYITEGMVNRAAQLQTWADRGVIAQHWRGGLWAYEHRGLKTPEQLASYWTEPHARGWPGAVIDELSGSAGAGEMDAALGQALLEARRLLPRWYLAVYAIRIGSGPHVEALRTAADRVLVETYQTDAADSYRILRDRYQAAVDAGLGHKALATLALGELGITTPQELRRQLHFVRYTFPAMPGVAFFGDMEPLDPAINQLLREFYVEPVLRAEPAAQGRLRVENIGATDAPAAKIELTGADGSRFIVQVPALRVGEHWLAVAPADRLQPRTSYADSSAPLAPEFLFSQQEFQRPAGAGSRHGAEAPSGRRPCRPVVLGPPPLWDREPPESRPGATTPWPGPQTPAATFAESFGEQPELVFTPPTAAKDASADGEQAAFCAIPGTRGRACQLEFDLQTIQTGYYGKIEIGCAEQDGKSSMNLVFYRGDHDRADYVQVRFCNADGLAVSERAAFAFQAERRYRLRLRCQPGRCLRLAIQDDRQNTLWDTGEIPIDGKAAFDRLRFAVRRGPDCELRWDAGRKALLLRSVVGPNYVLATYVDNLTMRSY